MEAAIAKLFGTDGLHRNLHFLEPTYGIEGQLQRYRIEKDRRDARVMTIYEGTNEIQQFLQLGDLLNSVGPKLEKLAGVEIKAQGSPFAAEAAVLGEMLEALHARVKTTRATYKRDAFGRVLLQPIFFRLSRMISLIKCVDSVVHRAHWIARNLTSEGDALRKDWNEKAARGFVARARREFDRLVFGFDRDFQRLQSGDHPVELALAETVFDEAEAKNAQTGEATDVRIERGPIARDLEVVVALEYAPKLAPRPRLADGRVAEHRFGFTAGDRRALRHAVALKQAAPDRVHVTLVCAASLSAADDLRRGLAAGADAALLLDTRGIQYAEHAVARAMAAALSQRETAIDLLLSGSSGDSPSQGRMARRLAVERRAECVPAVVDLWVDGESAVFASQQFPQTLLRQPLPSVAAVAAAETEPDWEFSTSGYTRALRKPLKVVPFAAGAERSDERYTTAAVTAGAGETKEGSGLEPEGAAALLIEIGELGEAAGGTAGPPYSGSIERSEVEQLDQSGVTFVPELAGEELARSSRGPAAAAASIAAQTSLPLEALVLCEPLDDEQRRSLAGQLGSTAPFQRIVFAEHPALAGAAVRAQAEALIKLAGPDVTSRSAYLVTTPWLADALPILAGALRDAGMRAEEIPGVSRVECRDGDGLVFVRPAYERKLRARRARPTTVDGLRIVWCEPEVAAEPAEADGGGDTRVVVATLRLDYDPRTDALAQAIAEARRARGAVTLENADFIIDVGAGLGTIDNLEVIVDPLRQALLQLGAPHVEIGATRKVTIDMSWLPDERQIGQTGVRVNPRVMIALGVSGAPQHIDWVGDRAVIFAFNLDPQAPLMTLNQRRERPQVYPVVGDLTKTVPAFIAGLRGHAQGI
jgi:electron transfer flavoprotein alpha subunit